jgi:hypothetical protein
MKYSNNHLSFIVIVDMAVRCADIIADRLDRPDYRQCLLYAYTVSMPSTVYNLELAK